MSEVSAKALVMVVSRLESVGRAVDQVSPEVIALMTSQQVHEPVVEECLKFRDRTKFIYAIVHSPMDIRNAFDRFYYLVHELQNMGYDTEDIALDATGGTTTMRLGPALAALSEGIRMVHQQFPQKYEDGGWKRDESRAVEIVPMDNPLESTGLLREGQGVELFDRRDYGAAALIFDDVARKVEGAERSHYYTGLALMAEGYAAWDVADYGTALARLSAARKELATNFSEATFANRAARLVAAISSNLGFLGKVQGKLSLENVVDMLENARRRIEDQSRYDDGVARLYRCIEMLHQHNLQKEHGLETKAIKWEKVSEAARDEFLSRSGFGELPGDLDLMRSRLLDHILSRSTEVEEENVFRDLLRQRNNSILAHGFEPIKEASAKNFLAYVDEEVDRSQLSEKAKHPRLADL